MFKGIWDRLKEDFSEGLSEGLSEGALPGTKLQVPMPKNIGSLKKSKLPEIKVNIIPIFDSTSANIDKYAGESYGYHYTDENEKQVDIFLNTLFENFDDLILDEYNIKYKGNAKKSKTHQFQIEVWIANEADNVRFIYLMKDGTTFITYTTHEQAAKVMFLKEKVRENDKKKLKDKVNNELEISSKEFTTMVTSNGLKIKITQKDIIESLRVTHPQHFI